MFRSPKCRYLENLDYDLLGGGGEGDYFSGTSVSFYVWIRVYLCKEEMPQLWLDNMK